MSSLVIIIVICILATVVCEVVLWSLFHQKMTPLSFPHELDTSYFRFFSLARIRMVAIVHTIVVAVMLTLLCLYLW